MFTWVCYPPPPPPHCNHAEILNRRTEIPSLMLPTKDLVANRKPFPIYHLVCICLRTFTGAQKNYFPK
jgi:hypothetical protein